MSGTVLLIGFQDQGNLGLGYLAAMLESRGYPVEVVDFRQEPEQILEVVRSRRPILIGFSLIFQFFLPRFGALAAYLRQHGIACHFTMGGHYPSLCHEEALEAMPELDSIVRFEGELTLLELVECLVGGGDWRDVSGIAYRRAGEIVATPLRPFIHDLDELPYPYRPLEPEQVLGRKALPILGSRGCARTCSFCSIHTFYRGAPGKIVRLRDPVCIVDEMRELYEERGVTIFLFQDDDFPIWGQRGKRWVSTILDELERQDLVGRVIWKISCRAEYVEPELFMRMRNAGLYLVYMGLESGTEAGLEVLNKGTDVAQNLRAVMILKELSLMFEYGFMLFDPSSTFASVRENIAFLRRLVGDGGAAATFCRMLPYGGTPIREQLAREGRLKGDVTRPDYDFLDLRLNDYFEAVNEAVGSWIHGDGVSHQLNWAWHELAVIERLFPPTEGTAAYTEELRSATRASNELLFTTVEESALAWERGEGRAFPTVALKTASRRFVEQLLEKRNTFIARNQHVLLEALAREKMSGPIVSPQIF
jgi:radical SAM superfamily enzyme YgiQ (UPF0313 family)